jgi:hypothetical protein
VIFEDGWPRSSILSVPGSALSLHGHGHTSRQRTERTLKLGKIEVAICLLLFDSLVHQFLSTDALPIVPDTSAQIRGGQRDSFGFEGWGDLMAVHSSISCEVTSVSTSCMEDIVLGGGRGQQGGAEISPPADRSRTRGNGTGGERTAGFHRFLRPNESELFIISLD